MPVDIITVIYTNIAGNREIWSIREARRKYEGIRGGIVRGSPAPEIGAGDGDRRGDRGIIQPRPGKL